jgi:hypothetical protein
VGRGQPEGLVPGRIGALVDEIRLTVAVHVGILNLALDKGAAMLHGHDRERGAESAGG